ncbi:hypothetical protein ACOSQ3_021860 [Xanthoceras sorbifolium]
MVASGTSSNLNAASNSSVIIQLDWINITLLPHLLMQMHLQVLLSLIIHEEETINTIGAEEEEEEESFVNCVEK